MQRRGQQSRFKQTRLAVPVQHRDAELWLNIPMILQPQPFQQATKLGATPHNHVLPVVNLLPSVGAGASLLVADVNRDSLAKISAELPVHIVASTEILYADADILAPCALGNVLTSATIPKIKAQVIAGAANNQLSTEDDGSRLSKRNILYAPDYVINAGGIINVSHEYHGNSSDHRVRADIDKIPERLQAIFAAASETGRPTNELADEMARRLIAAGRTPQEASA